MTAYEQLTKKFAQISHLHHLIAIAGWDEAVMMPIGGGPARAKAIATLQTIMHNLLTDEKIANLIEQAKTEKINDPWQKENLFWMEKHYLKDSTLPPDLVENLSNQSIACEQAWRQMRGDNNWQEFAPLLQSVIDLVRESAQRRADFLKKDPYDVLLDEFSPGLTQKMLDPIFSVLKELLPNYIHAAIDQQKKQKIIEPTGPFAISKQKLIGLELMKAIGFDFNRGRLDVSHHPFCGGVPEDVRITSRYNENEFMSALMAICHETGHACYEQNLPIAWLDQPVGHALGMSLHESQSLLIEMQACRSIEFMQFLAPIVKEYFGNHPEFNHENLHHLYTKIRPGYIRVDADELTYPLHVILRYELEKKLIDGSMKIKDLPEAWNHLMKEYLGLETKDNYRDGVMQDVHWPSGSFGYFPAYTVGALIAAQLFTSALKQQSQILDEIKLGNFQLLMDWLKTNVHQRASSVSMEQLLIDATGESLNPNYFLNHVQLRYGIN